MLKRINIFLKLITCNFFAFVLIIIILNFYHSRQTYSYAHDESGFIVEILSAFLVHFVVTAFVFTAVSYFFVRFFIKRPIRQLQRGMDKLAEKEFGYRLDESRKDEFGALSESFNEMASMLESSLNELKKNRDYIESILETSADIIIQASPSGKIIALNSGAENALGYQRNEVLGKPVEMLFRYPQERAEALKKLGDQDSLANYSTQFKTKEGEFRDVLLTISQIRNPSGDIIGTIGISKDVTEEFRLQTELLRSQRYASIGQVFTSVQHSMKNMLNACMGGAYMVRTGLKKENHSMLIEGWDMVQDGINSLVKMSKEMLQYVKEFKPTLRPVNLKKALSDIDDNVRQSADDRGIRFNVKIPDGLPEVICDETMIRSAVMDLVSNALDACQWKEYKDGEFAEVVLDAFEDHENHKYVIEVRDNGIGMTEEVKTSIFNPFFSTKSKSGTGLGLSITSRMIGVHDGEFDVESEPNVGTKFRIVLPIDGPIPK